MSRERELRRRGWQRERLKYTTRFYIFINDCQVRTVHNIVFSSAVIFHFGNTERFTRKITRKYLRTELEIQILRRLGNPL